MVNGDACFARQTVITCLLLESIASVLLSVFAISDVLTVPTLTNKASVIPSTLLQASFRLGTTTQKELQANVLKLTENLEEQDQ